MEKFRKDFGITLPVSNILTTSEAFNRSGANLGLKRAYPNIVIMGGDSVPGCDNLMEDGFTWDINFRTLDDKLKAKCFVDEKGRAMYYLEADSCVTGAKHVTKMKNGYMCIDKVNRCVLTGDTVFMGGCDGSSTGRPLLRAIDFLLGLPDDTKMFCAQEQTLENLKFCVEVEPRNRKIKEFKEKYIKVLKKAPHTVPSILGDEKEYNVFMRCRNQDLQDAVGRRHYPEEALDTLVEWKKSGVKPVSVRVHHQKTFIKKMLADNDAKHKLVVVQASSSGFDGDNAA